MGELMKKTVLLTILFVIVFLAKTDLFASYEDSLKLYKEVKYQESLQAIAEVLVVAEDMNPESNNYNLRFLAGHNHWKLKNYKNALAHLTRCSQIRPKSVDPLIDISLIFLELNRRKEATSYIYRVIKKDKNNALAYHLLAKIKLAYKNYWGAKELFEKALSINMDLFESWNGLGIALMNLQKFSQANTAFSTAHAMNSGSVEILNNLAVSYMQLNKKSEAQNAISKALEIEPQNKVLLKNMEKIESMN